MHLWSCAELMAVSCFSIQPHVKISCCFRSLYHVSDALIIIFATSSFLCNFLALYYNIYNYTVLHVFTCDVLFMEINANEMSYTMYVGFACNIL